MDVVQHSTQTWDTVEGAEEGHRVPSPRLVRFFRADDPLDAVEEFALIVHAAWTIGRVNGLRPIAPEGSRIWSCNDSLMSNNHATVTSVAHGWEIADAGSKNGTYVNGERLAAPHALADGDVIQCGYSFFIFREASVVRKAPPPATPSDAVLPPLDYQIEPLLPFAATDLSIHLRGETGVGKDVVARALHDLSGRRGGFVALNCAAIPDNLFESELFGYVRGAFSGATSSHRGLIAAADGGTLFLDEIGELSLPMQAKLLRVLEQKEVWPVGAPAPVRVNFRLVSATLSDLEEMIGQGRFRRDLYGRLGRTFVVPPLREHKEHLGLIVRSILVSMSKPAGQVAPVRFKIEAARAIVGSAWPLNIRELKQCIESAYAAAMAEGMDEGCCVIKHEHLPRSPLAGTGDSIRQPRAELDERKIASTDPRGTLNEPKAAPTDDDVIAALRAADGNRAEAARILGVSERTVFRRIGRLKKDGKEL